MNTPEIGSKWTIEGMTGSVRQINKRGRGYQVEFNVESDDEAPIEIGSGEAHYAVIRLRHFLKAAKPL